MDASSRLDRATVEEARALLTRCCGAERWVTEMLAQRPFLTDHRLQAIAWEVWFGLGSDDWLEAFSHHPQIGDRAAIEARFAGTRDLSQQEQAAVASASEEVIDALAAGQPRLLRTLRLHLHRLRDRQVRPREMLALLEARLTNSPEEEIRIAAGEQAKITAIRLSQLSELEGIRGQGSGIRGVSATPPSAAQKRLSPRESSAHTPTAERPPPLPPRAATLPAKPARPSPIRSAQSSLRG